MHQAGNVGKHRNGNRVSELAVSLRVRNGNAEIIRIPHEPRALPRRQPPGVLPPTLSHKDLRAVFVVPRGQGTRYVVRPHQAKTKSVSGGTVPGCIGLQVRPKFVRQGVFCSNGCGSSLGEWGFSSFCPVTAMQDRAHFRTPLFRQMHVREIKPGVMTKSNDYNALPVLRQVVRRINNPRVQRISKLFAELPADDTECPPTIMTGQVLDVLKQETCWPVIFQDTQDIEEKRALRLIIKAVSPAQSVLFGHPGNGKGLARKTGHQNIVRWNIRSVYRSYIACQWSVVAVICTVGLLRKPVPFGCEDTPPANTFHGATQPTDTREEINKFKCIAHKSPQSPPPPGQQPWHYARSRQHAKGQV